MNEEHNKTETLHACPVCGFHYRDEATAKKCEAWCNEHGACSQEITKLSVELTEGKTKEECEGGVCKIPPRSVIPAEAGAQNLEKTPEEKCSELEAAWKRALADYQNLQKEVAKERAEMGAYAVLRVVESFLPAIDHFRAALNSKPQDPNPKQIQNWMLGIEMIQKQFEDALRDLGLTPIKTVGEKFDATKHEAVGEESPDRDSPLGTVPAPGMILREVQAGYEINGKVVRPAKVIINK